jgi:putative nucleotidyltransferase with HDIG domain
LAARRQVRILAAFVVAIALATLVFVFGAGGLALAPALGVLLVLAYVSELLAITLPQHRVRITFSLPFIAGVSVSTGPAMALLVAALVFVLALATHRLVRGARPAVGDWALDLAMSVVCCSVAGLTLSLLLPLGATTVEWTVIGALVFVACYGLVNLLWVARISSRESGVLILSRIVRAPGAALFVAATYAWCTIAVGVLIAEGRPEWLPLVLLLILGLRSALRAKAQMYEHYYETIVALSLMLRRVHPYTHSHLDRVARIAERVALRLGASPERARRVREAAILHDIGKIAIDENILDKPGPLDSAEMEHVRRHSEYGAQILAASTQLSEIAPWVRHHHERPDGGGYPDSLRGEAIPLESRIIAVVDAYDAMVGGDAPGERRPYRERMSPQEATAELLRCAGTQFDPKVVSAFLEALEEVRTVA